MVRLRIAMIALEVGADPPMPRAWPRSPGPLGVSAHATDLLANPGSALVIPWPIGYKKALDRRGTEFEVPRQQQSSR